MFGRVRLREPPPRNEDLRGLFGRGTKWGRMNRLVLIVTPVSNLAGVARHLVDLARVGIRGWRIVITGPEGPLLDELRKINQSVVPLPLDVAPVPRAVAELRRLIRTLRPDIIHSHLARADLLAAMASTGLPGALVTTEHHISPDRFMFHPSLPRALAMETIHHLRLRRVDAAIAVSGSTKRDMRRWWRTSTPITVVRNGVDPSMGATPRGAGLRFLSLTRLAPEKNVAGTLRAFAIVQQEHPEAHLTVAGHGGEGPELKQLARALNVAEAVEFPGFVDAADAMRTHDVVVQPSRSDNLSYTLLDAVVRGMGVAASPVGGNPEILPERCIAPLDDDSALARIMEEQGLHPEKRPTLPAGIPTVEGMAEQIGAVYAEVVR